MEFLVLCLLTLVPFHVGLWKLFQKAGRKGWESVIPLYDLYVIQKLTGKPPYWILACIFPGINLVVLYIIVKNLYGVFGKNSWLDKTLGVILFFVFTPLWGFDPRVRFIPPHERPVRPRSKLREWIDSAVYAVVAVTILKAYVLEAYKIPTSSMEETMLIGDFLFVNKMSYGVRIPMTPLTIPFTHSMIRFPIRSFLEWPRIPYIRIPGQISVKRGDIFVFNFPEGDTILLDPFLYAHSYYDQARKIAQQYRNNDIDAGLEPRPDEVYKSLGFEEIRRRYKLDNRPVDKRENYIKRCVAVPGDVLEIRQGVLYVNGEKVSQPEGVEQTYRVKTTGVVDRRLWRKWGITREDLEEKNPHGVNYSSFIVNLTQAQKEKIRQLPGVLSVEPEINPPMPLVIFPHSSRYNWSLDNFGPLRIPKKGETVRLTLDSLCFWERIIRHYEGHQLEVKDGKIFIDGVQSESYTFKMNYYWAMGDNRHGSLDSRFWGFVPEDHVVGKAAFVFFSIGEGGLRGIRWRRMFTFF
ncbi:MAG: S26 family signal peptidase [Flavobacteriales bacterium]|nr:S26 family signal peptidase [Flavobacteriales bacterium]